MSKTSLRLKLAKMLLKFAMVETDKGILNYEGDLAVGLEVFIEDENGEMIAATDGEYVINEDGRTIVVAEGKITEIKEKAEETPAEEEAAPAEETMEDETPAEEVATPNYEEIINTLLTAVEELTARVDAMAAEIAEMKKEAVEEEIDDQFSKKKPSKTGKKCWERI